MGAEFLCRNSKMRSGLEGDADVEEGHFLTPKDGQSRLVAVHDGGGYWSSVARKALPVRRKAGPSLAYPICDGAPRRSLRDDRGKRILNQDTNVFTATLHSWRVLFDPATGTFSDLETNG